MTSPTPRRPHGWLKLFFKIPVWIARLGWMGWEAVLGLEWMLLTTRGRQSGQARYTMVDVLMYDPPSDTYIIEVGFGARSDWYQNIQACPVFQAQVGQRTFVAVAETLPPAQRAEAIIQFIRRRPRYARWVLRWVGVTLTTEDDVRHLAAQWLLLAVRPAQGARKIPWLGA